MPFAAEIYYQVYQDEAVIPLVLLHGAGGSHLSWPPVIRRLAGFRVYALDLPGHGKSVGRGQQSIAAYVGAVMEWMQSVGMHRAVIVGHSMGSAIAQLLSLESPGQTLALCLIGSAARLAVNPKLLIAAGAPETYSRAIQDIVAWSFSQNAGNRLMELVSKRLAGIRPTVLHGDLRACDGFDLTGRVSDIMCPTLVVCGAEDRMTPVRNSQFLADQIPDARLEIVPGAGHMVMLEKPQVVSDLLVDFLARIKYE